MAWLFGVAGLPRSGSSLLQCLLAQNPAHHCTGTSPFLGEITGHDTAILQKWRANPAALALGFAPMREHVYSATAGYIRGFYAKAHDAGQVIFDKNRLWLLHRKAISDLLEEEVKVVVTIRDLRAVVASVERLYQNRRPGDFPGAPPTVGQRVAQWLDPQGLIGGPISLLAGVSVTDRKHLAFIHYGHLVLNPLKTLDKLHSDLGLPLDFAYLDEVTQLVAENDEAWGMGETLHKIREGKIEPSKAQGWVDVLPDKLASKIAEEYPAYCPEGGV